MHYHFRRSPIRYNRRCHPRIPPPPIARSMYLQVSRNAVACNRFRSCYIVFINLIYAYSSQAGWDRGVLSDMCTFTMKMIDRASSAKIYRRIIDTLWFSKVPKSLHSTLPPSDTSSSTRSLDVSPSQSSCDRALPSQKLLYYIYKLNLCL